MVQVAHRDNKADSNLKSLDNNNALVLTEPLPPLNNHINPGPITHSLITTSSVSTYLVTTPYHNTSTLSQTNDVVSLVQSNLLQDEMAGKISRQLAELTSSGSKLPTLGVALSQDNFPLVLAAQQAKTPMGRGVIHFFKASNQLLYKYNTSCNSCALTHLSP